MDSRNFQRTFSRQERQALGFFNTPSSIAHLLKKMTPTGRVLDPSCGTGELLIPQIELRAKKGQTLKSILREVQGIEIDERIANEAKKNYMNTLKKFGFKISISEIPIYCADALDLDSKIIKSLEGEFDSIVGNPPWILWPNISKENQAQWKILAKEYQLSLPKGIFSRLGHSNDDVGVAFAMVTSCFYLKHGGTATFVLKRNIMRNTTGRIFRELKVKNRDIGIKLIYDFDDIFPFGLDVGAETAIFSWEMDAKTEFPIKTFVLNNNLSENDFWTIELKNSLFSSSEIVPLGEDHSLPWIDKTLFSKAFGRNNHEIRHGIKQDAGKVFSVDPKVLDIEKGLIFPYLKSKNIEKWKIKSYSYRIIPLKKTNEKNSLWLKKEYPKTYNYLLKNQKTLLNRKSIWLKSGEFYNAFGIGEYTWAPYKVAWCRLGFKPDFVVISTVEDHTLGSKPLIPGDHFMFIPFKDKYEAYYVCGLLNSEPIQEAITALALKSKSSLTKGVIQSIRIPPYDDVAKNIARLSKGLHGELSEEKRTEYEIKLNLEARNILSKPA